MGDKQKVLQISWSGSDVPVIVPDPVLSITETEIQVRESES